MDKKKELKQIISVFVLISSIFFIQCTSGDKEHTYYVDPVVGNDSSNGTSSAPFKSLHNALAVVNSRVKNGILSDKIILRGGVYKSSKSSTIYKLNMEGTPDNYAMISAMPCPPNSKNGVERKGGKWYEKVVFDNGYLIQSEWTQLEENPHIWQTKNASVKSFVDSTEHALFSMTPNILLQDGVPTIWVEKITDMINPGMSIYDYKTSTLFINSFEGKDPNNSKIEAWYGGTEEYDTDVLLLAGKGLALFDGDLQYAAIRGFEFRMVTHLFGLQQRQYKMNLNE